MWLWGTLYYTPRIRRLWHFFDDWGNHDRNNAFINAYTFNKYLGSLHHAKWRHITNPRRPKPATLIRLILIVDVGTVRV